MWFCPNLWKTAKARPVIFFVTFYEFFRQFAHMGFLTMAFLFLKHELKFSLYSSAALLHLFLGIRHVVSPLWSMLGDEQLNKKCALLLATVLGFIGHVMVTLAAGAPRFNGLYTFDPPPGGFQAVKPHAVWLMVVGTALITVGHGGPQEITRALGADQFLLPDEERHLRNYYDIFFNFMTSGTVLGIIVAPLLRMQVECLEHVYCFPLSFGVLGFSMLLAIVSLLCGWRQLYQPPIEGNPLLETMLCVKTAWTAPPDVPGSGLDKAGDEFTDEFIAEVRQTLRTLVLFIPLPICWAVMEMVFSSWIYQATRTTFFFGRHGRRFWHLEPDQMPFIAMSTTFGTMVSFERFIVCCRIKRRPLLRMIFGAFLTLLAAFLATLVQLAIEPELPYVPRTGEARLLLFSPLPTCPADVTLSYEYGDEQSYYETKTFKPMELMDFRKLPVKGYQRAKLKFRVFNYQTDNVTEADCNYTSSPTFRVNILLVEKVAISVHIAQFVDESAQPNGEFAFAGVPRDDLPFHDLEKCDLQLPILYVVYTTYVITRKPTNKDLIISQKNNPKKNMTFFMPPQFNGLGPIHLHSTTYNVENNWQLKTSMNLERGGVYVLVNQDDLDETPPWTVKVVNASSVHGGWQVPQLVLIGAAKFFLPITALEYSYQHVTVRMKPVLLSFWYISVALGNFLVAFFASVGDYERDAAYLFIYIFFTGVNFIVMIVVACNFNRMINK